MSQKILIADDTFEVAEKLQAALSETGNDVKIVSQFDKIKDTIAEESPDMLCVNAALFEKNSLPAAIVQQLPVVIYAFELDTQVESQFYEIGVKRVIVENVKMTDQVAAFVKMYQYRRQTLTERRRKSLTHGNLRTLPLSDLLQNAMYEKKNLIIKIRYKQLNVKILTYLGHVISCAFADKTGEEALGKALMLNDGSFTIMGYQKPNENAQMSVSVPAILAEIQFIQHKIQQFLTSLGLDAGNPSFKTIKSDKIFELPKAQLKVLDLVEEYGTIGDVLLHSPLNLLETVGLVTYFAENNLIKPAATKSPATGRTVTTIDPAIRAAQHQQIAETGISSGTIVILGNRGRSDLINTIAGHDSTAIKSVKSLEFTRLALPNKTRVTVFGISMETTFLPILDKVAEKMIGCVILLDFQDQTQVEFSSYLFNRIMQLYSTPFLVALSNVDIDENSAIQSFRKTVNVPEGVEVVVIDPRTFEGTLKIFEKLGPANQDKYDAAGVNHHDQKEEKNV